MWACDIQQNLGGVAINKDSLEKLSCKLFDGRREAVWLQLSQWMNKCVSVLWPQGGS